MPTPKRQIHRAWIAYYSVPAVICGVLVLIPGIDAEGKLILGVLSGVLLLMAALEWIAMKRTVPEEEVYTSLAEAPVDLQKRYVGRLRWMILVIAPVCAGLTYWELYDFESGEKPSARIVVPFNFVYDHFGKEAASLSILACGLALALMLHLKLRELRRQPGEQNQT